MSLPFLRVRAALILFHSSPLASLDPSSMATLGFSADFSGAKSGKDIEATAVKAN